MWRTIVVLLFGLSSGVASAGATMSITIRTDDPHVTILSVAQYGKPIVVRGLSTPAITFVLQPDEDGIPCDLDEVEVRTSNGVVHYPRANVCNSKGLVVLTTARVERPAGLTADPELTWIADKAIDAPTPLLMLTFGVPQTDGSVMFSTCQPRSGRITSLFHGDTESLGRAKTVSLDFYGPSVVFRYDAKVEYPDAQGMEESLPFEVEQSARNGFWQVLAQGHDMAYRSPDGQFHLLDTRHTALVRQFVKACGG